eukprot:jgi/Astpho2/6947/fgenesh1_pg.00107_%23_23_t
MPAELTCQHLCMLLQHYLRSCKASWTPLRPPQDCLQGQSGSSAVATAAGAQEQKRGEVWACSSRLIDSMEFDEQQLWGEGVADNHLATDAASEEDVTAHSQGNDKDSNSSSDSEYGDPAGGHGGGSIRPFQHEEGLSTSSMDGVPSPLSTVASAVPIAASVAAGPGARGMRRPPRRGATASGNRFAQSMPVQQAAVKMGSSAPINIPMLARQRFAGFKDDEDEQHTGIIPPHLLAAQEDDEDARHKFSVTGVSPAASLKREKLQQRNAILRRTGFIEGVPRVKGLGGAIPAGRDQATGNDACITSMQETKIRELTASLKDIACLEGWESIFAIATAEGQRGRHDVPNAGGASAGRPRLHFKMQFLEELKRKADSFRDAGREVFLMCALNMVAMPGGNRLFVGDLEAVAKLLNA